MGQLVLQIQENQWAPRGIGFEVRGIAPSDLSVGQRAMQKWHFILVKGFTETKVILQVHPEFLFHLSDQQHQLVPATHTRFFD